MNLIVDFSNISKIDILTSEDFAIHGNSLLIKIIKQVKLNDVERVLLLVKSEHESMILKEIKKHKDLEHLDVVMVREELISVYRKCVDFLEVNYSVQMFRSNAFKRCFEKYIDFEKGTIIIDGGKLYRKYIFNFSDSQGDAYVNFSCIDKNFNNSHIIYISPEDSKDTSSIRKIEINDYHHNYIFVDDYKSLIASSVRYSESTKLRYRYILELMKSLEYEEILEQVLYFATENIFWALFYLELLEGSGRYKEALSFYENNKILLEDLNIGVTQEKVVFKNAVTFIEELKFNNSLISENVIECINEADDLFEYTLTSIRNLKLQKLNLLFFINELIKGKKLNEDRIHAILDEIELYPLDPLSKKMVFIDIGNYLLENANTTNISGTLLIKLLNGISKDKKIFGPGIENFINKINSHLQITMKNDISVEYNNLVSEKVESQKRIAVCITGIAKSGYHKNLEIIKQNTLGLENVDYFIQAWDQQETYSGLGTFGQNPDYLWSKKYLAQYDNLLPEYLKRQSNFEAILPSTAKVLFSKNFEQFNTKVYKEVFGENLKCIKKLSYTEFTNSMDKDNAFSENQKVKMTKAFERYQVQGLLDDYIRKTGIDYSHVIMLDIGVVLESKIDLNELKKIKSNELYSLTTDEGEIDSSFSVSNYNNTLIMNSLWRVYVNVKSIAPYKIINNNETTEATMWLHLMYNKISVCKNLNSFGRPRISNVIDIPDVSTCLQKDLSDEQLESAAITEYFNTLSDSHLKTGQDDTSYKCVESVELIDGKIFGNNIYLEISIKGKNLTDLEKFHIIGELQNVIDAPNVKFSEFKEPLQFLKHDDDEIVVKKYIRDVSLYFCPQMKLKVMLESTTNQYYDIITNNKNFVYDINRFGTLYMKQDNGIYVGMEVKKQVLENNMKLNIT